MKISIEELIETADSLIAPVRMGVVRPTAPFALPTNSNIDVSVMPIQVWYNMRNWFSHLAQSSDELFGVEPFAPSSARGTTRSAGLTVDASSSRAAGSSSALADDSNVGGNGGGSSSGVLAGSFLAAAARHDLNYRLRALDDAADEASGMDGMQDDEDASEQDDLPADPRERQRPVSSNIDDEVLQDPLRNDENAQVN